jgi:hypothetical protein
MGTWGYEPLDNDAALDVQHIWENYVEERINAGEWTTKNIVDYFAEQRWGDAVNCGDNITNSEIIALLEIVRAKNLEIPKDLKRIAEDAINRELVDDELRSWEDPDSRKDALLHLLDAIGGKIKKPRPIKLFRDPSVAYGNRKIAERELMNLTRFGKKLMFSYDLFNNKELKESVPEFVKTLNRFVHHGLWEKDSNIVIEATAQRLMMIAYYLGMSLGYEEERIKQLIDDAKWEKK